MRAPPAKYNLAPHERRCSYGLICPIVACGTYYMVGAPGAATVSVAV